MFTRIPRWEIVAGIFLAIVLFWALAIWIFGLDPVVCTLGASIILILIFAFTGFPLFQIQDWLERRKRKIPETCGN